MTIEQKIDKILKGMNKSDLFVEAFAGMFGEIGMDTLERWSDQFYPDLYCGCLEATETACLEQNIVELWADQVILS